MGGLGGAWQRREQPLLRIDWSWMRAFVAFCGSDMVAGVCTGGHRARERGSAVVAKKPSQPPVFSVS